MDATSEEFTVDLEGGSPWGFTLLGGLDHRSPLRIGRVTVGGRAASKGLVAGDYILFINGQSSKELKHLQAQQIIKRSKQTLQLCCTKARPGVLASPATNNSPTFSFPLANGSKTPPTKVKAGLSVSRPKPPTAPGTVQNPGLINGHAHARHGSLDTPSESTASISSPSSLSSPSLTSPPNTESYNVKFMGLQDTPPSEGANQEATPTQPAADAGQCNADTASAKEEEPKEEAELEEPAEVEEEAPKEEVEEEAPKEEVEEEAPKEEVEEEVPKEVEEEAPKEEAEVEAPKEEAEVEELKEEVEDISAMVEDIEKEVEDLKEVVTDEGSIDKAGGEEVSVSKESSPGVEQREKKRASFSKRELVDVITQAAQTRVRRESSTDLSSSMQSDSGLNTSFNSSSEPKETTPPQPTPVAADSTPPKEAPPPQSGSGVTGPTEEIEIKPSLTKKKHSAPLLNREPGWYQHMFQSFSNTVKDAFPGAKSADEKDPGAYMYDERGLKVRRDSLRSETEQQAETKKPPTESPEPLVYVYDDRGLRVPVRRGQHMRGSSTPAILQDTEPTTKLSASDGAIKDDILTTSKKTTYIKTRKYSTDNSRDYWKQKDKQHIEFDEQRRRRSEETTLHQRQSSADYAAKMTHMHPLLMPDTKDSSKASASDDTQQKVFDRIDASKLQGALTNASMLTNLEHEGVPSHLLPALAQSQQQATEAAAREEEKKKALKPPPAPKAQALFNFQGKNEKELSFNKGDFVTLTHTVDENWLEGASGETQGIFPANYVKVLTMAEYEALVAPKPPTPELKALALFDFEGQTKRELGFNKGDILIVDKKVDDNWYSGTLEGNKGIFPAAYVKIMDQ